MSLLRFGGKDPQGNAKGIEVDSNGRVLVSSGLIEKDRLLAVSVNAGETKIITANTIIRSSKVLVNVKSENVHTFDLLFAWRISGTNTYGDVVGLADIVARSKSNTINSGHIECKSTDLSVRIQNNSEENQNYDIYIWEVR